MREREAQIAMVAVPAELAADIAALAVAGGVRGILNLTPARLPAFSGVFVHQVDLSAELTLVSFYLSRASSPRSDAAAVASS
jgi:redox-sensing transcriptional repressor